MPVSVDRCTLPDMTNHAPQPAEVLVLDLETTDSDPYVDHAAILEIGAILCAWAPDLPEIARASLLVRPNGTDQDHTLMWQAMPPVVQQMHTTNGLWKEATTSDEAWGMGEADTALARWIAQHTTGPVPLLGSGVGHLDQPFVKAFMPATATRLKYWPIDIGNIRRGLDLAGRSDLVDIVGDVDAKPHRGLGDAELHLEEARRYLRLLGRIPADAVVEDGARL